MRKKEETKVEESPVEEKPQMILQAEVVEEKPTEASPVEQLAQTGGEIQTEPVETIQEEKSVKSGFWVIWIAIAFVLGAAAGFALSKMTYVSKPKTVSMEKKVTVEPTSEPTAVPTISFDRSSLKVKVLNGSGKTGKAAAAKSFLEGLGYKGVETGNADSDTYEMAQLSIKQSLKSVWDKIKTDVAENYQVESEIKTLAADDAFDVLIVLGKK